MQVRLYTKKTCNHVRIVMVVQHTKYNAKTSKVFNHACPIL